MIETKFALGRTDGASLDEAWTAIPQKTWLLCEVGATVYRENEPARFIYQLVLGTVVATQRSREAEREIIGYFSAGEIIGREDGPHYRFTVEALTECLLLRIEQ